MTDGGGNARKSGASCRTCWWTALRKTARNLHWCLRRRPDLRIYHVDQDWCGDFERDDKAESMVDSGVWKTDPACDTCYWGIWIRFSERCLCTRLDGWPSHDQDHQCDQFKQREEKQTMINAAACEICRWGAALGYDAKYSCTIHADRPAHDHDHWCWQFKQRKKGQSMSDKQSKCACNTSDDLILIELRKIVEGNAAVFAQVRMIRMMMEKQEKRAMEAINTSKSGGTE